MNAPSVSGAGIAEVRAVEGTILLIVIIIRMLVRSTSPKEVDKCAYYVDHHDCRERCCGEEFEFIDPVTSFLMTASTRESRHRCHERNGSCSGSELQIIDGKCTAERHHHKSSDGEQCREKTYPVVLLRYRGNKCRTGERDCCRCKCPAIGFSLTNKSSDKSPASTAIPQNGTHNRRHWQNINRSVFPIPDSRRIPSVRIPWPCRAAAVRSDRRQLPWKSIPWRHRKRRWRFVLHKGERSAEHRADSKADVKNSKSFFWSNLSANPAVRSPRAPRWKHRHPTATPKLRCSGCGAFSSPISPRGDITSEVEYDGKERHCQQRLRKFWYPVKVVAFVQWFHKG